MGGSIKDCYWLSNTSLAWRCGILSSESTQRDIILNSYAHAVSAKTVITPSPPPSPRGSADSGATDYHIAKTHSFHCVDTCLHSADGKANYSVQVALATQRSPVVSKGYVFDGLKLAPSSSLVNCAMMCVWNGSRSIVCTSLNMARHQMPPESSQ